jgi:hypothetical protein
MCPASVDDEGGHPVSKIDRGHGPQEFPERSFSDLPSFSGLRRGDPEGCPSFLTVVPCSAEERSERSRLGRAAFGRLQPRAYQLAKITMERSSRLERPGPRSSPAVTIPRVPAGEEAAKLGHSTSPRSTSGAAWSPSRSAHLRLPREDCPNHAPRWKTGKDEELVSRGARPV